MLGGIATPEFESELTTSGNETTVVDLLNSCLRDEMARDERILVFGEDVAANLIDFFRDESCGQCTPCRNGTEKALALMRAQKWDRAALEDLWRQILALREARIAHQNLVLTNILLDGDERRVHPFRRGDEVLGRVDRDGVHLRELLGRLPRTPG